MQNRSLGRTGLAIAPLVFGGNVFGWTADKATSFALLDQFVDAGFNAIDTADVYSAWAPGNAGGESETIIGEWMKRSKIDRDRVVIVTKVGSDLGDNRKGLSARWIAEAVEASLTRLQTDHVDLYLSHWPDAGTPYEETLGAYDRLLKAGKVRAIGASNLDSAQLRAALDVSAATGLPRYDVLQPEYNLYDRDGFDGPLRNLCLSEEIGVITYYSLASGFLTGKYRSHKDIEGKTRGQAAAKYLDGRGMRILGALDAVADATGSTPATIALAWLMARKGVTAPIASATTPEQLTALTKAARLALSDEMIRMLSDASE
ncbi:aldo/keto reductase [Ensifer soli]|uniref:aldo/keto reductase n=1 Tax=Ciceribacter sp. sgz301302 TaxID=3342379 RepID=UPI0035B96047